MSRCSPSHAVNTSITDTCFSRNDIFDIALRTRVIPNEDIQRTKDSIQGINIYILSGMLHSFFGTRLGEENKWLKDEKLPTYLSRAFRNQWSDGKPHDLLDSVDIRNVLLQYEESHPFFMFLGVQPLDFQDRYRDSCIANEDFVCNFSYKTLLKYGKTDFGLVINHDTHDLPGSHWVACYGSIDPSKKNRFGVFYFDSIGNPPLRQVGQFMDRFISSVPRNLGLFTCGENIKRLQFGNTECGVYSIAFINNCLFSDLPYSDICDVMPNDTFINKARHFILQPIT